MNRALVVLFTLLGLHMVASASAQTTAFYYGREVPRELSAAYDQIVIEPGHPHDLAALAKGRAVPVAYVSLGEVSPDKLGATDPSWRLTKNAAWASTVMDLSHPGYRSFVMAHYEKLWSVGYRRFFFDTLDSYQLGTQDPKAREQQRRSLCDLIASLAARHPDARFLLNRGFELLPDVAKRVHGVVAESLFDRYDAGKKAYVRVPENDRAWLLGKLREVRDRHHLPVIVIDYRPADEREQARVTAQKIKDLGFQPWVTNGAITDLGVGPLEILPRRVLIVTDRPDAGAELGPARFVAPVLEYLGYVPEYRAALDGLPQHPVAAHYAGIVSVLPPGFEAPTYERWLDAQLQAGVRVALIGGLGFRADGPLAARLGIQPLRAAAPGERPRVELAITTRDAAVGFEAEPPVHEPEGVAVYVAGETVRRHLELRTRSGAVATAIATTPFGGVALSHVLALRGLAGERAWIVDPFAFLQSALRLPILPAPDVTSESGKRLLLLAVDAQGLSDFARLRGRPTVARVLASEILARHPWPHALHVAADASPHDRAAARSLVAARGSQLYAADVITGTSAERGPSPTLTGIAPLWAANAPEQIPLPIADDLRFIGPLAEAYPLRRMRETFVFTEQPRRLRPLALHYHAFALSSPGGLDALAQLYAWLRAQDLLPVRVEEYRARVTAFREQVVARALDGSFELIGGAALRTARVPEAWGAPDAARSLGVELTSAAHSGVRYVTFSASGPRKLAFGAAPGALVQRRAADAPGEGV